MIFMSFMVNRDFCPCCCFNLFVHFVVNYSFRFICVSLCSSVSY